MKFCAIFDTKWFIENKPKSYTKMDYKKWIIRFFWIILVLSLCEGKIFLIYIKIVELHRTEILNIFRRWIKLQKKFIKMLKIMIVHLNPSFSGSYVSTKYFF